MKRRTLFGLPLIGLFGFWPRRWGADEPLPVPPAAPIEPYMAWARLRSRTGPTMDRLIDLAENDPHARGDYDRLLSMALQQVGVPLLGHESTNLGIIYHCGEIPAAPFGHRKALIRRASSVPVPESLLSYFRPENRGEDFPRGVPYKHMP